VKNFLNIKSGLKLAYKVSRWYKSSILFNRHFPLISVLYITNKCNYGCKYCGIWKGRTKTMSFDLFKKIIDYLHNCGCFYVSISGGEPLLAPDVFKMIEYAKKKIPYVHMVTNGSLITPDNAARLNILDDISVSLDGFRETHDKIRGKGSYNDVIKSISYLKNKAPNLKIVINTIISPDNINELIDFTRMVRKKGLYQKFQVLDSKLFGTSTNLKIMKDKNYLIKLKEFIKYIKHSDSVINSKYYIENIIPYFTNKLSSGLFKENCKLPYYYCEFLYDGTISPCLNFTKWKGVSEFENKTINSKKYKNSIRDAKNCKLRCKNMPICHIEPRTVFPFSNFLRYTLLRKWTRYYF